MARSVTTKVNYRLGQQPHLVLYMPHPSDGVHPPFLNLPPSSFARAFDLMS